MVWHTAFLNSIKTCLTLISRVIKLEERVSALEQRIEALQVPPKDIKEGLDYDKEWNYYVNKATGECFCSTCLADGKKVPVVLRQYHALGYGAICQKCDARYFK